MTFGSLSVFVSDHGGRYSRWLSGTSRIQCKKHIWGRQEDTPGENIFDGKHVVGLCSLTILFTGDITRRASEEDWDLHLPASEAFTPRGQFPLEYLQSYFANKHATFIGRNNVFRRHLVTLYGVVIFFYYFALCTRNNVLLAMCDKQEDEDMTRPIKQPANRRLA